MSPPPREDKPLLAFLIMAVAVACFSMIDTLAKWLGLVGMMASLQVVFIRYAGHFLASLAAALPREGWRVFRSNRPGLQAVRALALASGTTFNFIALKHLSLNVTTAFFFACPIVVSLMSIPLLGERVGPRRFAAVVVGFVGVLIVLQPWGDAFSWAMLYSVGALFSASTYFVLTRMIAGVDDNAVSQIYSSGLPTLVLLPLVVEHWMWPTTSVDWLAMLTIGPIAAVGHTLTVIGHRYAPASTLAPVVYVQVIYITILSYLVFHTLPTEWTALGTAVIIASGIYIWLRERALAKQRSALPNGVR